MLLCMEEESHLTLSSKFKSYLSFVEEIVICYIEVPFKILTSFWALNFEEILKYFR